MKTGSINALPDVTVATAVRRLPDEVRHDCFFTSRLLWMLKLNQKYTSAYGTVHEKMSLHIYKN